MEQKYGIWAVHSANSVCGDAENWYTHNGKPVGFDTMAQATKYADHLNESSYSPHVSYYPEAIKHNRVYESNHVEDRDELISLAQEGDRDAMDTLIDMHQDFLGKMTAKYFMDGEDRDDLLQIARWGLWDAIEKWNHTGNFEAYAGQVIKGYMTNHITKHNADKRKLDHDNDKLDAPIGSDDDGGEFTLASTLQDRDGTPETHLIDDEDYKRLLQYIEDTMSDREREVIERYVAGDTISDIADDLGVKYKSIENALMRIRNKLEEYMYYKYNYTESQEYLEPDEVFTPQQFTVLYRAMRDINRAS